MSKQEQEVQIRSVLADKVDPVLAKHFGGATLTEFQPAEGIAWIKMTGACGSCEASEETIQTVVAKELMEALPFVKEVRLDRGVSEDLMDMARKILAGDVK